MSNIPSQKESQINIKSSDTSSSANYKPKSGVSSNSSNRVSRGTPNIRKTRNDRGDFNGRDRRRFGNRNKGRKARERRKRDDEDNRYDSQIIQVRRITRVVKGGKRMRFSALVVVGDKQGRVGFGLKKGVDFQESVRKAIKQATENLIKIKLDENESLLFETKVKFKSSIIMIKPADQGTGLISGGFVRPVFELAGIKNAYSKIIGSSNKVTGVQAVFEALKEYNIK